MTALFAAQGVTKRFGGLTALQAVDFELESGIASIIGPNGAGKTTLFNIFTGLYPADAGSIVFRGRPLLGLRPDQITTLGICRTFQNIRLFANMTVIENVLVGMNARIALGLWDVLSHGRASAGPSRSSRRARSRYSTESGSRRTPTTWPATSRTATSVGSSSPVRSRPSPRSCCSTSRPPG